MLLAGNLNQVMKAEDLPIQTAPPIEATAAVDQNIGPHQHPYIGSIAETTTGYQTVIDNGPSSNRVDLIVLGDGYTVSEIDTTYVNHVNSILNHMFNNGQDPFPRYANFFNAHRINTISNESGADKPPQGIFVDTAFDSYYFCGNIERLLCVSNSKVDAAKTTALAGAPFTGEMEYVTVNDTKYGGSGGRYAVYAGGNSLATEVALHEVAHSFDDLADEYGGSPNYTGPEPREVNVTTNPSGAKWNHWIGYDQPVIGTISAYEGARYFDQGIYRPSSNSKMRSLGRPFDAVSREKIILDIYNLVDPLDDWLPNGGSIVDSDPTLWVDSIDSTVIDVQWFVDGNLVVGANAESFRPRDFGFTDGSHSITARAFDPTDWVRRDLNELEQSVSWSVDILPIPDVTLVNVNNGSADRSNVTSLSVYFNTQVTAPESAFVLTNRGSGDLVGVQVNTSMVGDETVADLTFQPGPAVMDRVGASPNSLIDGNYELRVIAAQVAAVVGGSPMPLDYRFGDTADDGLFRFFGDSNGDRDVDTSDLTGFGATFRKNEGQLGFDAVFDELGDGDVDVADLIEFGERFRGSLPF